MAFDQNSVPKDMRSLNVAAPTMTEETLFSSPISNGRSPAFFVSDPAFVGYDYRNMNSAGSPTWCVRPIADPNFSPATNWFNYAPSFGNRVVNGNALNFGNCVGANSALDKACYDAVNGFAYGVRANRVVLNASNLASYSVSHVASQQQAAQSCNEGADDTVSGKKVKFLCSYGGRNLPRPSDGELRYVGGQTRIISVRRDASINDLLQKMVDTCGQPVVIKYQLPEEDLDALVSVSCADDVENMMDEYDKLVERSPDGSAKLRVFLFPASELELSGRVQFGDLQDSGQKYFDAVNGVADVISSGINWKESIISAVSIQNSDLSGPENPHTTIEGQGDFNGAPMGNVSPSADTAVKLVVSDPSAAVHSGAYTVSSGTPLAMASSTYTPYSQEVRLEKSVPVILSQQPYGLQQAGMEIHPPSPYLQPFIDMWPEIMDHADCVQQSPQTRFSNPQLLGKTGPVFNQQQFHDNTPGLESHQVISGVKMTMAPPSSQVDVRPIVIPPQPLVQPQQNYLDQYNDQNTPGLKIIQHPAECGYNAYQVPVNQVPPVTVGEGIHHWVQVPSQEKVVFSNRLLPQQVMIPEKIQRVEDCSMCQTKLPHAHSDTAVQDQFNSRAGPIPDSIPIYRSLPVEDNLKAQATNTVMVNAPLKEGLVEQGADPRVISKLKPPDRVPCSGTTGLTHNSEQNPHEEKTFMQITDGHGHPRNSFIQDTVGRTNIKQYPPSDGVMAASYIDVVQQHTMPVENQAKQVTLVNKPLNNDMPRLDGTTIQASECMVQGSPKEFTNELTGVVSKPNAVDNRYTKDHLKPIDVRMHTLKIDNPEIYASNGDCLLPVDKLSGNDKLEYHTQHAVDTEVILDNNFGRSKLIVDANQIKMSAMPPSSEEISRGHNSKPGEYYEVAPPAVWGIPSSNPLSISGNHHRDDVAPSSISPPVSFGDVQDSPNSLFSNQHLWNVQHGTFFQPVSPSNVASKKETYSYKDYFAENPGNHREQNLEAQLDDGFYQSLEQNLTLEHDRSDKVSAEDQQLQAIAEGVAASVLHTSTPSNSDSHTRDVSCLENIGDNNVENNLIDVQCKSEIQDIKSKPPEKTNFCFPASDVGRLQVIKNCDLEELTKLGSGTFGTVYHGKWRGTDVAIKRITDRFFAGKPSEQECVRDDFWNEAIKLADLHHPNVVAFYGIVLDGPGGSVATVTEYMVNGSLRNALHKSHRNLDKRKRLMIAMDVAFGMEYLHGKNIVHFDLKSDNLLVNLRDPHRQICKVGDLGLSKVKRQTLISGGVRGTLPWMAPELLNGSSSLVSEKVDVFSFGIVMWELLTGQEPYTDLHYGAIIGGIVSNTLRPPVPESCDQEWRLLMERCWSAEPSKRPSFTEIANELRSMATKISPKGQSQQQQPTQIQQ
ncbi:unnamed protein product [Lupinus luteus]|uniref:Protein kinase domain-containing protein n=1 Tax=Lupinus luteus TaxID=3873 RepID=A0AAV1XXT3_LUPLU